MKARSILLGTVAAFAFAGTAAATPFHGWYVAVEGGADWIQDSNSVDHFVGLGTFNVKYIYKTGWAALGTVGYSFSRHWRIEGEVGYRANDIDHAFAFFTGKTAHGHLNELTVMANLIYDIPLTSKLDLSLGVGAGGDDANFKSTYPGSGISDSTWDFAYQGIAGLNYQVGQRSQLFLNYRYLTDTTPTFSNTRFTSNFDDLHKHAVTIGLRYDLSADEEPAPPPAPAPAPMPVPPPSHFIIFFGFNKCNITSEADSVLSEAASAAKSMGSASVTIVGHTDTVGSSKYNQRLSECRANAAASNLTGKGIPAGAISTSGKGKSELMVQTGDNVKEPQNRRATVDVH
jgi:OOP family OmpA-OmpF porin